MAKATGSGSTISWNANAIGYVKSITFGSTRTAVDATDNSSSEIKEYLAGDEDGTLSVVMNYDPSDTAQAALLTDFYAGTSRQIIYMPTVGSTLKKYTFTAYITGLDVPSAHETTLEMTASFQITGGVTVGAQT